MTEIICALIAAVSAVIVAYQNSRTTRYMKNSEARAARRAHESRLSMELMYATCNLSMMTARHVMKAHSNEENDEELATAIKEAEKAKDGYIDLVRDEASKNFSKV